QLDADHHRPLERVRTPGHRDRDLGGAGADREHSERAGHRRVAVRADQHLPWAREALEVQVVGDAVAGARVERAVPRRPAPEVCAVVVAGAALVVSALLSVPAAVAETVHPSDLWPFLLIGALVPGASQVVFILAVRDAGPSRAAILIGTAPLMSVGIALALLREPARPLLILATAL